MNEAPERSFKTRAEREIYAYYRAGGTRGDLSRYARMGAAGVPIHGATANARAAYLGGKDRIALGEQNWTTP